MPTESQQLPEGWTLAAYIAHNEALREAEARFQEERDRRYTEVNIEKEKALKIKETADLAALSLARDIQIYKDEKANELREQINSERGLYATKSDLIAATDKLEAIISPIAVYMAKDSGRGAGFQTSWGIIVAVFGMAIGVVGVILSIVR